MKFQFLGWLEPKKLLDPQYGYLSLEPIEMFRYLLNSPYMQELSELLKEELKKREGRPNPFLDGFKKYPWNYGEFVLPQPRSRNESTLKFKGDKYR